MLLLCCALYDSKQRLRRVSVRAQFGLVVVYPSSLFDVSRGTRGKRGEGGEAYGKGSTFGI